MNIYRRIFTNQKCNLFNGIILLIYILAIYWRSPLHFWEPTLWAEEGTRYFAIAYDHVWYKALMQPTLGYLSLWPNLALTVAVNLFTLEWVPLIATFFALFVQLMPVGIILWSHSRFWRHGVIRVIGVCVVLVAPLSEEVWLNTITSQFHFLLVTFLLLIEDVDTTRPLKKWWYRILLLLSGLTGAVSSSLLPLFMLAAWREKKVERFTQTSILLFTTIIQISALWSSVQQQNIPPRWNGFDLSLFISFIWTRSLALLFLGLDNANAYASMLDTADGQTLWLLNLLWLFPIICYFVYHALNIDVDLRIKLIGSYFSIFMFMVAFSHGNDKYSLVFPQNSSRYSYVSNVILMFIVLANIRFDKEKFKVIPFLVAFALLIASLGFGVSEYIKLPTKDNFYGPNWKEEISAWQQNPQKVSVQIAPIGWKLWIGQPQNYRLTDRLSLARVHKETINGTLTIKLLWYGNPTVLNHQQNYTAYAHVIDSNGKKLSGYDNLLLRDANPLLSSSYHIMDYPADCVPANTCHLRIGIYYFENEKLVDVYSVTLEGSIVPYR